MADRRRIVAHARGAMVESVLHEMENHTLKNIIIAAITVLTLSGVAQAQDKKEPTAQQALMGTCNKEASGKKGDDRKAFMKDCLADGKKRQQEVMKACNLEAKGKNGDERKKFMSECMKK